MKPVSIDDYRRAARRQLPRMIFDYLEGGSEDETLIRRNVEAFAGLEFQAHRLTDVSQRDQGVSLFGQKLSSPFLIGPTGMNGVFRPDGDILLARAAKRAGIPFTLSTPAGNSIEEVSEQAGGNLWFQLYVVERGLAESLTKRALAAGYKTLVLTTDVAVNGIRDRDVRNGFGVPFSMTPRTLLDGATHPGWSARFLKTGMPELANFSGTEASTEAQYALMHRQMDASFSWDDLAALRQMWPHTLLVKGILSAEDAAHAESLGVDGVVVSNHGGRQLDGLPTTAKVLPEIADAVDVPVLVDGGIRRGADIVKAIALGADAVQLGRAPLYGLAAQGEKGVDAVLQKLRNEVDTTLALIGASSLAEVGPHCLRPHELV